MYNTKSRNVTHSSLYGNIKIEDQMAELGILTIDKLLKYVVWVANVFSNTYRTKVVRKKNLRLPETFTCTMVNRKKIILFPRHSMNCSKILLSYIH